MLGPPPVLGWLDRLPESRSDSFFRPAVRAPRETTQSATKKRDEVASPHVTPLKLWPSKQDLSSKCSSHRDAARSEFEYAESAAVTFSRAPGSLAMAGVPLIYGHTAGQARHGQRAPIPVLSGSNNM